MYQREDSQKEAARQVLVGKTDKLNERQPEDKW